jgi:50S ribosomal subunit-associated GTPase HflX
LESALHCDLALIVCDATDDFDMQMQTTLQTLEELEFSSPYLLVMNKCENLISDELLPYGSIPVSAKENIHLDRLKREILRCFANEYAVCELFVPYEKTSEFSRLKSLFIERRVSYENDGQLVEVVVNNHYIDKLSGFIRKRKSLLEE